MKYRVLCITDRSDRPETELFVGLKKSGVDISVIGNPTGKHYHRLKESGISSHDLILKSRFDVKGIRFIRNLLQQNHFDILYCFNNPAASNTLIASRGMAHQIITYRGTIGNVSYLSPASWTTHLHPRVNRIICVSNAVRDFLMNMKFLWKRLPAGHAQTIYKGHDISWYRTPAADLSRFNIPAHAFTVGFAGRNRPHKGIDYLLKSAQWLPPDAAVHFILMGNLDDANLRAMAQNSPFKNRIHFTGYRNDVPAIVAACDAFIMPSTKREGLSRAVIEAMSCGTAPIVTDVGGLPEMAVQRESGLIIPPENSAAIAQAILELYQNPDLKKKMGENARRRIQTHFNIETTVEKTRQLFEEVISATI
ncbi:MAG: glycosyltransferase family 4 protein [Desulfobacterales bacterium]|jgi:glycosyltransferase involved in cell wall biosynthesis|nr:glycosyltransferase family 4 protein [Desulfobacterales bacterium]